MDPVKISLAFATLLLVDVAFVAILLLLVAILAKGKRAAYAVLRRNFTGYFSNPTGYVFLCIFVFLTSLAAFWPYEFFNDNLATLDQLNRYLPWIMLIFIPAITMSIWAEEKRQGTDELLLTLPADDFDIVMGKFLAASSIFTCSLLFSQISNFITLAVLSRGDLDIGLFFTTYLGYWFVGLTMIAIGMVASFLTGNLTVGFILGALFNAPLAFASLADAIFPPGPLQRIVSASGLSAQFDDFGRGVISISSTIYFVLVGLVGIYVCMVLIGKRNWTGSKDGNTMAWHYLARTVALMVGSAAAVILLNAKDVRYDATEGKVSSLSPATLRLIKNLDSERPIVVDAFISDDMPEQFTRTRYELVSLLKEFRAEAAKQGKKIQVNLQQDLELFSEEAALASERFGIEPVQRMMRSQGSLKNQELILGAAIRCGLDKVIIPLFEYGIPVEYELVRSIKTVSQAKRKKVGVVTTDAQMMGGYSPIGGQQGKHPIITELEKQYDVQKVDLNSTLDPKRYDAVLAVQPSTLPPEQFDRFVDGVSKGMPTAIFEDPIPRYSPSVVGTGVPKPAMRNNFGQTIPGAPKGDIRKLWEVLQLEIPGSAGATGLFAPDLVWQQYNPYPKLAALGFSSDQWIFGREEAPGTEDALSDDSLITQGLSEVLMLFAGAASGRKDQGMIHTPIVSTGSIAGRISFLDVAQNINDPRKIQDLQGLPSAIQTTAMTIEEKDKPAGVRAVYVADIDLMQPFFLAIRSTPEQFAELDLRTENVNFLLNCVDWLSGEHEFIEVRAHQPNFTTLVLIEEEESEARKDEAQANRIYTENFQAARREMQEQVTEQMQTLQKEYDTVQKKREAGEASLSDVRAVEARFTTKQRQLQRTAEVRVKKLERERDKQISKQRQSADLRVRKLQNLVKGIAVTLPCIPPLVVGVIVFASRRLRERENIATSRLR